MKKWQKTGLAVSGGLLGIGLGFVPGDLHAVASTAACPEGTTKVDCPNACRCVAVPSNYSCWGYGGPCPPVQGQVPAQQFVDDAENILEVVPLNLSSIQVA